MMSEESPGNIVVNGALSSWSGGVVLDLLHHEGLNPGRKGFAVALNGQVVSRKDWPVCQVSAGDKVEIVTMYKGG